MNNERRAVVRKAIAKLAEARELLDEARVGEEEAVENLPESLQESERAERMREVAEELGGIVDEIETKESYLEDIIG